MIFFLLEITQPNVIATMISSDSFISISFTDGVSLQKAERCEDILKKKIAIIPHLIPFTHWYSSHYAPSQGPKAT